KVKDRSESLVLDDCHFRLSLGDSRLYVTTAFVAFALQDAAFDDDVSALGNDRFKRAVVVINGHCIDKWTDVVILVKRISDAQLSVSRYDCVFYFVVNAFMDDQTTGRCTTLSCSSDSSKHGTDNGHF